MPRVFALLRYALITVAIALIPAWPDLMGHAPALAAAADSAQGVLCNAHYLLLIGMFLGGILLVVAPRPISQMPVRSALASGGLGAVFLVLFGLGMAWLTCAATVATGVMVICLYGSIFYLLAETADFKVISYVSACALALKALILPFVGVYLPEALSFWLICLTPAISAVFAALYGQMCRKASVEKTSGDASPMKSYGKRTSMFMAILICVSSVVFAVARAGSNLQFWGSQNTLEPMGLAAAVACTAIFLVICYSTFTCAPGDLMLRFMPCLLVQLIAYGLLWCGALPEFGVTGQVGVSLFTTYTELYSHMYFFMVMFVGLSMLGTGGVRVHGAQWAVFSAALFIVLALGQTELTLGRFLVVLVLNVALAAIFLVAHQVYGEEQVEAIKSVAEHGDETSGGAPISGESVSTLPQAIERVSFRYGLSEREREVFELLVQGRSRAFIGEQLCLASGTVGTYVSRIYEKVRVHSKQELLNVVYDEVSAKA
jgi:DNA-binding CsgD family transcriptional regulator